MVLQAVQGVRYLASMAISPLGARKMMPQQTFSLKSKKKGFELGLLLKF
jgi:hypothetical protein